MPAIIQTFITFLSSYKYLLIIFFALVEGRVIAMFAGFLISIKELAFWPTYLLLLIGNLIPDSIYYFIGRFGSNWRIVKKYKNKISQLEKFWTKDPGKIVIFGKLTMVFIVPVLIFVGLTKFPYKKFLIYSIVTDIFFVGLLIAIGYFSGSFYQTYSKYLYIFAIVMVIIFVSLFFIIKYIDKNKFDKK